MKENLSDYENLMIKITNIIGEAYENGMMSYAECVGVFTSAQHFFIDHIKQDWDKKNED
jgi:hypothetical protein